MKKVFYTVTIIFGLISSIAYSQPARLTVEPGVGIHTNFGTDVIISNLTQWNSRGRLSLGAYSALNINNVTKRNFSEVRTNYNYSLNQKFGPGIQWDGKKVNHTLFVMAGIKYTAFEETLENPNLNTVSASVRTLTPDYGMMYSMRRGKGKYFLTGRFYLPLSPWLTKGAKADHIQGTLRDVALEIGLGFRIK